MIFEPIALALMCFGLSGLGLCFGRIGALRQHKAEQIKGMSLEERFSHEVAYRESFPDRWWEKPRKIR